MLFHASLLKSVLWQMYIFFLSNVMKKSKAVVCSIKSTNESTAYGLILKRIEDELFRDDF